MAGKLYDENNVVVGHAVLWLKPWNPTTPATPIADSTPLFTWAAWETALWKVAGATDEGFKATVDTSTTTVTIEEQSTPVVESVEAKSVNFEAALAEDTLDSIQLSWGGSTIVTVAAASGTPGTSKMTLTDVITNYAATLEYKNFKGFARRIFVPKMSCTGSGDTNFRRAAAKHTYPVKFVSLCKPTDIQIVDITAAALP